MLFDVNMGRERMAEDEATISIDVPEAFRPYAEAVVLRLGYIFPENPAILTGSRVQIRAPSDREPQFRREVTHLLYREKVYSETLPVRRALFQALKNG